MKYRDENGDFQDLYLPPSGDTLPIGSEVDYNGETVPYGWEEVTNPEEYSTDEVKTNKVWIDGKPIYRKVINITSGMSTSFNVPHNIANVDYLEITSANIFASSTNNSPIYYYSSTDYFRVFRNGNNLSIRYGSGNSPVRIVIILEYTKTTD